MPITIKAVIRTCSFLSYKDLYPPVAFARPGKWTSVTKMVLISWKNTMQIAIRVPICRQISNKSSGSLNPSRFWHNTRWPELLTGKNSVKPWIMPRNIACNGSNKIPNYCLNEKSCSDKIRISKSETNSNVK